MIAIFTLVDAQSSVNMVVIFGNPSGGLGFFASGVTDFVLVANPATFGFKVFV